MHRALLACFVSAVLIGCSSQQGLLQSSTRQLVLQDFVLDIEDQAKIPLAPDIYSSTEQVVEVVEIEANSVSQSFEPKSVGIPLTVEALVGQVNGRPIYANAVLDPVSDQLAALSTRLSRSKFAAAVRDALYHEKDSMGSVEYGGRLYELVITDLLLSEASSGLSKEQSYGIFAMVQRLKDELAAGQGGSLEGARYSLADEAGISVEDFLEFQRNKILIDALYREKIWPKVTVSWRDLVREFEQVSQGEQDILNANNIPESRVQAVLGKLQKGASLASIAEAQGNATLGLIRIPKEDERIAQVESMFLDNASFAEVADAMGIPKGGVWQTFELDSDGLAGIEVSALMKSKLEGAVEGDILEPFDLGRNRVWLSVLQLQDPISIYNRSLQIALRNHLQWIVFNREKSRFVKLLWGEGSIEEVQAMAERVANIAVRRFLQ